MNSQDIKLGQFTKGELNVVSKKTKVGDLSWGQPEGSLFDSYYTEV